MKRLALPALTLGLVAGLSGCGGPPTDASKADFCQVFTDMNKVDLDQNDEAAAIKLIKDTADKLEKVGTPSNISDSARKGFELTVEKIQGLKDSAKMSDIEDINKGLSKTEESNVNAFDDYEQKECGTS